MSAGVGAIVPAAGAGRRSGAASKLFRPVHGVPVLAHTLRALARIAGIRQIVVVVQRHEQRRVQALARRYRLAKVRRIVIGGATRMESVRHGLAALASGTALVLIHDAARPCVSAHVLTRTIRAAERSGAAIAAMPATDTIKQRPSRRAARLVTLPRQTLWIAQTPQVFRASLIQRAYARAHQAGIRVTDDAAAVERLGHRVTIVPSDASNLKITWPTDFAVAHALLNGHHR